MANLYCFGDSYITWHRPELHWTLRFQEEYKVHRLGKPGSSNQEIIWQTRYLPSYQEGDRIIFVFAELSRLPKWFWDKHYKELAFKKGDPEYKFNTYVDSLLHLQEILIDQVDNKVSYPLDVIDKTSAYDFYQWLPMLNVLFKQYRPIYLTWSKPTYNVLESVLDIKYIDGTDYTSVTDETGYLIRGTHRDGHPGEEGGKVWYNIAKELLDRK